MRVLCFAAAVVGLSVCAAPAYAGGSWFEPDRVRYEPGDSVTLVGYTGGGQLGWIDDGPFFGYLSAMPAQWAWGGGNDAGELPVGEIFVEETGLGGWQTLRASITFTLPPDLEPGTYEFVYCNAPCTTGLGDLIGGIVYVGVDPPVAPNLDSSPTTPTSIGPPPNSTTVTTATPASVEADSHNGNGIATQAAIGGAGIGCIAAVGVLLRRRTRQGP